jgi:hypothetical protein
MGSAIRSLRPGILICAAAIVLATGGCQAFRNRGGGEPETTATTTPAEGQMDVRRFLGPNYCPELRIPEGGQLVREYERGHDGDEKFVIWQASVGNTARECLYDLENNLTLKVGVSGRVISGPKGGAGTVTVPVRIVVVKHKEAVLSSNIFPVTATIPAQGSTVFTNVHEVVVPSPGEARDYILYVALGEKDRDWLNPIAAEPVVAEAPPVEEPIAALEEAAPAPPPAPPKKSTPNELPVPSGGFVLTQ